MFCFYLFLHPCDRSFWEYIHSSCLVTCHLSRTSFCSWRRLFSTLPSPPPLGLRWINSIRNTHTSGLMNCVCCSLTASMWWVGLLTHPSESGMWRQGTAFTRWPATSRWRAGWSSKTTSSSLGTQTPQWKSGTSKRDSVYKHCKASAGPLPTPAAFVRGGLLVKRGRELLHHKRNYPQKKCKCFLWRSLWACPLWLNKTRPSLRKVH